MVADQSIEPTCVADLVAVSLRRHGIAPTPDNYALWYEYHAGNNPSLERTIDAIISNHAEFDEKTLDDLYSCFFSLAKEKKAIRETSARILQALKEASFVASDAGADAQQFGSTLNSFASTAFGQTMVNLRQLIVELVQESQRIAGRSEFVSGRMRESADKIERLEQNLEEALRDAALDSLTGIANRRTFDQTLRRLAGETMNSGEELGLLMLDIDHFKRVNDQWGHQKGDLVLQHLAKVLQKSVRGEDLLARYGGEEFAVLLPRTDLDSAVVVGENIRRVLAREPMEAECVLPPVTVSIGAAVYDFGEPLQEWAARADQALYSAKQAGRDCVRSA
jgi:diguanylate cyclase